MTRLEFPYLTPDMIGPAEQFTISLIATEFPEIAYIKDFGQSHWNELALKLLCETVNMLTGSQPPTV